MGEERCLSASATEKPDVFDRVLAAFKEAPPMGWSGSPARQLDVLKKVISAELAAAVRLDRPNPNLKRVDLPDLFQYVTQRHGPFSPALCEEARGVEMALAIIVRPNPEKKLPGSNQIRVPVISDAVLEGLADPSLSLGRPCRYCWRTATGARSENPKSWLCEFHQPMSVPDANVMPDCKEAYNRYRSDIDFAKRLLKAASPDLVYEVNQHRWPRRPVDLGSPDGGRRPVPVYESTRSAWPDWLHASYRLTFEFLVAEEGQCPDDPLSTIAALEGRALTLDEFKLYKEPIMFRGPLERCESWQILIQRARKVGGRRPCSSPVTFDHSPPGPRR